MTVALSQINYFFSLDSPLDIGGADLKLSLDQETWVDASPVSAPAGSEMLEPPDNPDFTRYWWSLDGGPGKDLQVEYGTNIVHGRLDDVSSKPYMSWRVYVPRD